MLMRVAQLVGDHAEITAADLNPIIVSADGRRRHRRHVRIRDPSRTPAPLRRLE